jgi:hypothetical protein
MRDIQLLLWPPNDAEFSRTRVKQCTPQLPERLQPKTRNKRTLDQRVGCNELLGRAYSSPVHSLPRHTGLRRFGGVFVSHPLHGYEGRYVVRPFAKDGIELKVCSFSLGKFGPNGIVEAQKYLLETSRLLKQI